MAELPTMPLFTDAYLADTRHLSIEQHGAYLLLLMTMWRNGAWLPSDPEKLANYLGLSEKKFAAIWQKIGPFFSVEGEKIFQKKLVATFNSIRSRRETAKANGALGGRPKSLENKEADEPTGLFGKTERESKPKAKKSYPLATSHEPNKSSYKPQKADLQEAVAVYNTLAEKYRWPQAKALTKPREQRLFGRLNDAGGLDGWRAAMARADASDYLSGRKERTGEYATWTPSLDFFLQQSSFVKLLEGFYDNRGKPKGGGPDGGAGFKDH